MIYVSKYIITPVTVLILPYVHDKLRVFYNKYTISLVFLQYLLYRHLPISVKRKQSYL